MHWTTNNGERISIRRMSSNHIERCIGLLEENDGYLLVEYGGFDGDGHPWYDVDFICKKKELKAMKKELVRRKNMFLSTYCCYSE